MFPNLILHKASSFLILMHSLPTVSFLLGIYFLCCSFFFPPGEPGVLTLFPPYVELSANHFFLYFVQFYGSLKQKNWLQLSLKEHEVSRGWDRGHGAKWILERHPVALTGTLYCLGSLGSFLATPLATHESVPWMHWRFYHLEYFCPVFLILPPFPVPIIFVRWSVHYK